MSTAKTPATERPSEPTSEPGKGEKGKATLDLFGHKISWDAVLVAGASLVAVVVLYRAGKPTPASAPAGFTTPAGSGLDNGSGSGSTGAGGGSSASGAPTGAAGAPGVPPAPLPVNWASPIDPGAGKFLGPDGQWHLPPFNIAPGADHLPPAGSPIPIHGGTAQPTLSGPAGPIGPLGPLLNPLGGGW